MHCRDDDQSLHNRLAQSCSLDSGKAYPQRRGVSKGAPYADHGSYRSSDGTPVGDVDYHRPHGHHASAGAYRSSGSSNIYYSRQQGLPPHDRPAHSSYEPSGPYSRGDVSFAGVPPAGGAQGSGAMGGAVRPGSDVPGSYGPGPGYGHPYVPGPGYGPPASYGGPPQRPYAAPGAYGASPDAARVSRPTYAGPGGPAAMGGGYGGPPPPHMLEHPMSGGPGGYGPPRAMYGMPPPPPPPPRQLPAQQAPVESQPAAAHVPGAAGPDVFRPAAATHMETPVPPLAAPAAPRSEVVAQAGRAAPTVQPTSSTANTAVASKTTPFAVAEPAPAAEEAPAAPKNEFAERLAQRAMASAAKAKSSLLAGGSSALSSTDSLSRHGSLAGSVGKSPARIMSVDVPAVTAASGTDSGSSSPSDPSGVFVKPSHPFGRPKLVLKPRSVALDAAASGNYSSTSSDSGDAPADHSAGSAAGSVAGSVSGGRPRLNLLPRRSSMLDSATAGSAAGARKPSVFGEAKPREEVLKQRGLDPALVDAAVEVGRRQAEVPAARQGSAGDRANLEDEWHTVSGHGRKGAAVYREARALPEDDGFNPFFDGSAQPKTANCSLCSSATCQRFQP